MNFDRNSLLGFGLLAILFFGYFYYTNQEQAAYNKSKARQQFIQDSIAKVNRPVLDTVAVQNDLVKADSVRRTSAAGFFVQAVQGIEELISVENEKMKVVFSSKGAQIKYVELKEHRQHGEPIPIKLATESFNKFTYPLNTGLNRTAPIADLYFTPQVPIINADGSKTISFKSLG